MSIRRIRLALKEGRYEYSIHALEEMDEDHLADSDVYEAIMKGNVVAKLTGDPRGTRFVVRGLAVDEETEVEAVCRFLPTVNPAYNHCVCRRRIRNQNSIHANTVMVCWTVTRNQ